ncbi:peptidase M17 [Chryseobacterium aahli]|uniref:M17 family peptidase N-terminal domain-containing protein n=1 Tax=Chryseobacterium aahli TaxID=1278643 RepID=UPI001F60C38A|nr:M17 family peptidase N-terminal domain-containing protein [Chryseobacterium aahli]MCI3937148.1 peptidase M17 [Chryseobacterium aahli]
MKLLNIKKAVQIGLLAAIISATPQMYFAQTTVQTTPANTSKIWGKVDGIAIEGMVQGPSTEIAPLQIACVFEYTEGDIFNSPPTLPEAVNGMVHLDKSLNGIITELRKSGRFAGHSLETLIITPPSGTIGAKKLLLIGLGDRNQFKPELMQQVASVGMEEAIRLGVTKYAFATDLKDAGIDSPTAEVARYGVTGAINAYRTQVYLKSKKMSVFKPIEKITLLAGPAFFTTAGEGITKAIAAFNK